MTNLDVIKSEDKTEEALRDALEASKRAYLTAQRPDQPVAKQLYKNALRAFSEYVMRPRRA